MTDWRTIGINGTLFTCQCGAVLAVAEFYKRRDAKGFDTKRDCANLGATQRELELPASR